MDMDKKSKILVGIFILILIVSIFLTYQRAFVDKNFEVLQLEAKAELYE